MEMSEKNEIRKLIKEQRKNLIPAIRDDWDDRILEKVLALKEIRQAYCVYCYVSMKGEAGTHRLMEALSDMGKYIAVPKVNGKELDFYMINSMDCLKPGAMGILEPDSRSLRICDPEAPVIVPGLAFDRNGSRIGYGGGYYDRFLQREPDHTTIGICYEFQLFDWLKTEPFDYIVDRIVMP